MANKIKANKIKDKVAIVTGAGQGNGRGIAVAFAKEGAKVVVAEIKPDTGEAVAEELRHLGTDAIAIVCDVSDKQQVQRVVDETIGAFGRVDILVNNAQAWSGYSTTHLGALAEALPKEWWDLSFDTGVRATWYFCKAVFPHMKDRGGKIINFTTTGVFIGTPLHLDYNVNKAAVLGFTKTAAREWGPHKINVNCLCPIAATPALLANLEQPEADVVRSAIENLPKHLADSGVAGLVHGARHPPTFVSPAGRRHQNRRTSHARVLPWRKAGHQHCPDRNQRHPC